MAYSRSWDLNIETFLLDIKRDLTSLIEDQITPTNPKEIHSYNIDITTTDRPVLKTEIRWQPRENPTEPGFSIKVLVLFTVAKYILAKPGREIVLEIDAVLEKIKAKVSLAGPRETEKIDEIAKRERTTISEETYREDVAKIADRITLFINKLFERA